MPMVWCGLLAFLAAQHITMCFDLLHCCPLLTVVTSVGLLAPCALCVFLFIAFQQVILLSTVNYNVFSYAYIILC